MQNNCKKLKLQVDNNKKYPHLLRIRAKGFDPDEFKKLALIRVCLSGVQLDQ
jgi:hypothetical protein